MLHIKKSSNPIAITGLVGIAVIWGLSFTVVKHAITRMPVLDFLSLQFTGAVLVLFILRPACLRNINVRNFWHGVFLGLILGLAYTVQTFGMRTTPAGVSGFITGMSVVFTPVIAWLLLRHLINWKTWLSVALATAGLALLSLHGWSFGTGELLILVCAILFALYIVVLGKWSAEQDSYKLTVIQLGTAAIVCLVAASPGGITMPPDLITWGAVVYTVVLATALAYLIQTWAQSLISPTHTAIVLTFEPVFAGFFAVVLGHELLTIRIVTGAICVLLAMLIIRMKIGAQNPKSKDY